MEGERFSYVEDLTVANDFWHMKARIIRKWEQTFKVDMVLLDERGKKIQASVKRGLLPDFEEYLKEDVVIVIRKFGVAKQRDRYRVLPLNHKINFFKCTSVQTVTSFQGSLYAFNFIPFEEINQTGARSRHTVDVMGRISWCGDLDIFKAKEKESKRVNFELQNLDGLTVRCTVWGKYAEQVNRFVSNNNSSEMVICIMQHAKIKRFNRQITVQNDMYGTRIFLNEKLDEANTLRRSLILRDGAGGGSQTVLSSQTVYPYHNEFVVKCNNHDLEMLTFL